MGEEQREQSSDLPLDMSNGSTKQTSDLPDELLINVLSHVPSEYRMDIRQVSQKWNEIISDIGYLNTIFNTNLGPRSRQFTTGVPRVKIETDNRLLRNTRVGEKRSEFITSPPISVIKLKVFVYTPPMRPPYPPGSLQYVCSATLRTATPLSKRPEGVRVGDLLDCLEKVAAYARKKGWVWHGLAQSKDLSSSLTRRWKVVQLGKVKNGIDVRKPRRVEGRSYCFSGSGSYSGSDSGTDSDSDIDVD